MGVFEPLYDLRTIRPASYNPRKISDDAMENLRQSILEIGWAKPIIVEASGTIVAGHQRTKAALSLGMTHAPAYLLTHVGLTDEVKFNQYHNATDIDAIANPPFVPKGGVPGEYELIQPGEIEVPSLPSGVALRGAMAGLLMIHGPWGASVATTDGEVIASPHYAMACRMVGMALLVFRVRPDQKAAVQHWLSLPYGSFSYDKIGRKTWVQSLAQPKRLAGKQQYESVMYEKVLPKYIPSPESRILDFGCGRGAYVQRRQNEGAKILGVEFFPRLQGKDELDTAVTHSQCDALAADLEANGRFDLVFAEAVVNSTDSIQAHDDVFTCLSAFCKPEGRVILSGRLDKAADTLKASQLARAGFGTLYFPDSEGFTAILYRGSWFFQRFHKVEDILPLGLRFYSDDETRLQVIARPSAQYWFLVADKSKDLPLEECEASIRREFNLPWPGGKSVGRADQVVSAWKTALGKEIA